ncbi:MAG: hypothetical protein AAF702_40230 [Chloroflexota bacterium]
MTFDVIIQKQGENDFIARPVLWPDSAVNGSSQQDVLTQVRILIRELLIQTELVQVDVDIPDDESTNPWIAKAGIISDDPTWGELQTLISQQ